MDSPKPNSPPNLESIRAELQALRDEVAKLGQIRPPEIYKYPDRIPRALVVPTRYTSSLPLLVLMTLRRYAEHRGGEHINVIVSEALRAYIPRPHFTTVLEDLLLEQERLWLELATPEERRV